MDFSGLHAFSGVSKILKQSLKEDCGRFMRGFNAFQGVSRFQGASVQLKGIEQGPQGVFSKDFNVFKYVSVDSRT